MRDIHNKKAHDYARDDNRYSNFENAAKTAGTSVGAVFRTMIGIKCARLAELEGGKSPNNESIQDSLLDLATYAALYASYYTVVEKPEGGLDYERPYLPGPHPGAAKGLISKTLLGSGPDHGWKCHTCGGGGLYCYCQRSAT